MAKSGKKSASAGKKSVAKTKSKAKVAAKPKKVAKPAARKAEPRKAEPVKKSAAAKPVAAPRARKGQGEASKPAGKPIPQLTVFPGPTTRPIAQPRPKNVMWANSDEKSRYSDEELKEFEALIQTKVREAREELKILKDTLNRNNDEGTDATSGGNTKVLEDGAETAEKENLSQLAARQQKYIGNLEAALIRIKNGTYGICTVTGKLIPKERLMAVPHTTQSIEAKMLQTD
jgi:RNA polymerase-binding transcription factor DksA